MDIDYIGDFLDYLMAVINQNGWSIDNIDYEQCLHEFNDDEDYPIRIIRHLIDSFTRKELGKY
jgi:hypothetical protein